MAWIVIEVTCGAYCVSVVIKKFKLCSFSNLFFVKKLIKFYPFVTTQEIKSGFAFLFQLILRLKDSQRRFRLCVTKCRDFNLVRL